MRNPAAHDGLYWLVLCVPLPVLPSAQPSGTRVHQNPCEYGQVRSMMHVSMPGLLARPIPRTQTYQVVVLWVAAWCSMLEATVSDDVWTKVVETSPTLVPSAAVAAPTDAAGNSAAATSSSGEQAKTAGSTSNGHAAGAAADTADTAVAMDVDADVAPVTAPKEGTTGSWEPVGQAAATKSGNRSAVVSMRLNSEGKGRRGMRGVVAARLWSVEGEVEPQVSGMDVDVDEAGESAVASGAAVNEDDGCASDGTSSAYTSEDDSDDEAVTRAPLLAAPMSNLWVQQPLRWVFRAPAKAGDDGCGHLQLGAEQTVQSHAMAWRTTFMSVDASRTKGLCQVLQCAAQAVYPSLHPLQYTPGVGGGGMHEHVVHAGRPLPRKVHAHVLAWQVVGTQGDVVCGPPATRAGSSADASEVSTGWTALLRRRLVGLSGGATAFEYMAMALFEHGSTARRSEWQWDLQHVGSVGRYCFLGVNRAAAIRGGARPRDPALRLAPSEMRTDLPELGATVQWAAPVPVKSGVLVAASMVTSVELRHTPSNQAS